MTLTVSKKSLFGIPAITISWIVALATMFGIYRNFYATDDEDFLDWMTLERMEFFYIGVLSLVFLLGIISILNSFKDNTIPPTPLEMDEFELSSCCISENESSSSLNSDRFKNCFLTIK
tara:strand:- start:2344 stop:2700 length:357 start_codon:yes stop_codon:yes gene_type:complete